LSFSRHTELVAMRAWSHTNMYAPGARITAALSGEKNPASVFKRRTYYYFSADAWSRSIKLRSRRACRIRPACRQISCDRLLTYVFVIPAKAGIQSDYRARRARFISTQAGILYCCTYFAICSACIVTTFYWIPSVRGIGLNRGMTAGAAG